MSNAIKWTPGLPPEPEEDKMYLVFCCSQEYKWTELILGEELVGTKQESIKAHALINYPLPINEAIHSQNTIMRWVGGEPEMKLLWHYWDLNGTTRSTGYATREEAEAAYHDEYGDW